MRIDRVLGVAQSSNTASTDYGFVFVEVGQEVGKAIETQKRKSADYCHILAKHQPHFLAKGIDNLSKHSEDCLLLGDKTMDDNDIDYVMMVNANLLYTVLGIGKNGFLVTAFPVSTKTWMNQPSYEWLVDHASWVDTPAIRHKALDLRRMIPESATKLRKRNLCAEIHGINARTINMPPRSVLVRFAPRQ